MTNIKHCLLTVLVALVSSLAARAYDFEVDGIFYNVLSLEDRTCEVTYKEAEVEGETYRGDMEIPSKVTYGGKTFEVKAIGYHAFIWCRNLKSIKIPNSVTIIKESAFWGCVNLESVSLPENVTLSSGVFALCGFTSVDIPKSTTVIYFYTFAECKSLTHVEIPEDVVMIENTAFVNCTGLTSITIPNKVREIGWSAFQDCANLTTVTLGTNLTSIQTDAFKSCTKINEIISLNPTPPVLDASTFDGISKTTCVVKVPERALSAYQSAEYWNLFWNIEAIPVEEELTIVYEGTDDGVDHVGGLDDARPLLDGSSAPNAIAFCNTVVDDATQIPVANLVAKNPAGEYVANVIKLYDLEPFYCPFDVAAEQIVYTRIFNDVEWQPLYVPFSMNYDDWADKAEVAYVNNVHQWDDDNDGVIDRTVLEFITKRNGHIEPNKPYIVRPLNAGVLMFTVEQATLCATPATGGYVDCRSTTTEYTLSGTYQPMKDLSGYDYYAMLDGGLEVGCAEVSPFRTYLKTENRIGAGFVPRANRIGIMVDGVVDNNNATVLSTVLQPMDDAAAYSLTGQRVGGNYKGVVIKNGKKAVYGSRP